MKRLSWTLSVSLRQALVPLAISLILALSACATAPTAAPTAAPQEKQSTGSKTETKAAGQPSPQAETKPAAQTPKYGGILHFVSATDVASWDDPNTTGLFGWDAVLAQKLMTGDWTKGPAGGYGTKDTDWATFNSDIFANKTGSLAESWKVDVDNEKLQATIIFKLRSGVHFALNPNNEASKLVGGREMTADDVLANIKQVTTDSKAFVFRSNAELRNLDATKTGPLEITVKVPLSSLVTALSRIGDKVRIFPPEVSQNLADWKNHVGTGAFMLTDYVAGSKVSYVKNPNFWMKDPIGPGKGNQLPYIDGLEFLIIPDVSTQMSALRTGKIDTIQGVSWEDSDQIKKELPQMPNTLGMPRTTGGGAMYMRTDKPPFNDIRVRRALMIATDFNTIKQTINGGYGNIITFPFDYYKEYAELYVGLDDPDLPPAIKELYTYSPDKAKQLLAEAGFPNGLKTSVLTTSTTATYYEMIASMWAKAGITLAINVQDNTVLTNLLNSQTWDGLAVNTPPPVSTYYNGTHFNGVPSAGGNTSFVDDPGWKDALPRIRVLAATDEKEAKKQARDLAKYALDKAWTIQIPSYRGTTFWWPWLKNYAGEISAGYHNQYAWAQFVWIDQDLKKSMGH